VPLGRLLWNDAFSPAFHGDAMAKRHHVALAFAFLVIGLIAGLLGFTVSRALRSDREFRLPVRRNVRLVRDP